MFRCFRSVTVLALLAGLVLLPSDQAADATQVKNAQVKRPTYRPPTRANARIYRVQVRQPIWQPLGVAPNRAAARTIRRALSRQGWATKSRLNRATGQVAVAGRMLGWHTRAIVTNPVMAAQAMYFLQAQGFQARVK